MVFCDHIHLAEVTTRNTPPNRTCLQTQKLRHLQTRKNLQSIHQPLGTLAYTFNHLHERKIHTPPHWQPGSLKGRCCRSEGRASSRASGPTRRHDEGNQHRRGQETSAFGGRPWRRLVDGWNKLRKKAIDGKRWLGHFGIFWDVRFSEYRRLCPIVKVECVNMHVSKAGASSASAVLEEHSLLQNGISRKLKLTNLDRHFESVPQIHPNSQACDEVPFAVRWEWPWFWLVLFCPWATKLRHFCASESGAAQDHPNTGRSTGFLA